ncbi:MFS family permease [Mycolicibacterium sp. BK556]|uniref:MFS transporter n=1 Tax=Mycobacteriaceae TaxID=1762 RepID=UPI0010608A0E|nr:MULTISPECIES: MFS transporter [Mycobacteriaceae]MBB3606903.1 MFS family permease [Mycolicibacterium sp. BK556]MBB3636431.1 MFS family permease [Mycolicibacterium sp. BK607]MBB3754482.1 MFS family permease [Mycolicibacterium sp. BK634]TDO16855.1 transmembrane secretion effector [Mycobacterium sp. BK086]
MAGGYALLRQRQFRALWLANVLSSFGLVMLLLGAAWVMTTMTSNPLLVSMVQTATSLPFLILGIPAGIIADLQGHRRVLLGAHTWMLLGVAGLAVLTFGGHLSAAWLLVSLSLIGIGLVFQQAAWKPFLHDLLPADQLVGAISLNSLSNKLAQVAGPLLGGVLVGVRGAILVFGTRALSHLVMMAVVRRVPKPTEQRDDRSFGDAAASFADGWRYLRSSRRLYGPMIRCAIFMLPCAGMVALLPLEAKENIQTEVIGYGGLLTTLAVGTVSAVSAMPWLQRRASMNVLSSIALGGFSLAVLGISQWDSMLLDASFLLVAGFGWGILTVAHQWAVQTAAPNTMRGLMTSFYTLVLQGSLAAGSFLFGLIATQVGVSTTILICGLVAAAGLLLVRVFPMP